MSLTIFENTNCHFLNALKLKRWFNLVYRNLMIFNVKNFQMKLKNLTKDSINLHL